MTGATLPRARVFFVALAGLTGVAGCWVPKETGQAMQRDIRALQEQQSNSEKGLAEQRAQLAEQMKAAQTKIDEVARTLDDLNRASHNTDADFGVQIERLIKEVQELRGAIELTDYRLGKIEAKLEGEASLTARIEKLEREAGISPPASSTPAAGAGAGAGNGAATSAATDAGAVKTGAAATPAAAQPPKGKKELLAYAQGLVKDGKAGDARGVYRDIIKQWPGEVGITDEAYYRLGDTYFDDKKFRSALQEYIKVVEKFASGDYADDAYYKIGLCSMEIGNLEDAKIFFSEIVNNHKKSPLAKNAKTKLDEINARLEKEKKQKSKGK